MRPATTRTISSLSSTGGGCASGCNLLRERKKKATTKNKSGRLCEIGGGLRVSFDDEAMRLLVLTKNGFVPSTLFGLARVSHQFQLKRSVAQKAVNNGERLLDSGISRDSGVDLTDGEQTYRTSCNALICLPFSPRRNTEKFKERLESFSISAYGINYDQILLLKY